MMILLFYLIEFFVLTSAAVATPFVLLNTSDVADTVSNRPNLGAPDPRFKIEVAFRGPRFPLISCLMNTVKFLVILGLEDFQGSMENAAWSLTEYPEVGLVIEPSTEGGTIERRFVVWGLSQGVAHMIYLSRFQSVVFSLSWEGDEVGTLELVAWPFTHSTTPGTNMSSTQKFFKRLKQPLIRPTSNMSVVPEDTMITADPTVNVRILLMELKVPPLAVFLTTIAVLVDAAEMEPAKRLKGYASPTLAAGAWVVFEDPVPPRTSPPFFEAKWLITTMAAIPEYMIRKGVFEEAILLVDVDGVNIAAGSLRSKEPQVGVTDMNFNASVS